MCAKLDFQRVVRWDMSNPEEQALLRALVTEGVTDTFSFNLILLRAKMQFTPTFRLRYKHLQVSQVGHALSAQGGLILDGEQSELAQEGERHCRVGFLLGKSLWKSPISSAQSSVPGPMQRGRSAL